MKQKYLRLQEMANKAKNNARVHERKAQRMADIYTKAKSKNENLYIANKKLWGQVKDTKIGFFLEHNEKKVKLSKENPIIGKRK